MRPLILVLLLSSPASALPLLDEPYQVRIDTETTVTIFKDDAETGVYWWAPYRARVARVPGSQRPWLKWTPDAAQPRLTFAVELAPYDAVQEAHVRGRLLDSLQAEVNEAKLRPLILTRAALTLEAEDDSFLAFRGDWQAPTSLFPIVLSETVPLSSEANQLMLTEMDEDGVLGVALNVRGEFFGRLSPRRFTKEYGAHCVAEKLRGSTAWTLLGFYSVKLRIERDCVTSLSSLGKVPSLEERVAAWDEELAQAGILTRDGAGWRLVSVGALEAFATSGIHADQVEISEAIGTYPVAFGALVTRLVPTRHPPISWTSPSALSH